MPKILKRIAFLFLLITSPYFFSQPALSQADGTEVSAEFDSLWVDYDVTRDGQKGMVIHAKFTVSNMLNVPGYLTIRILGTDDQPLQTATQGYRNKNGELAVFRSITPAYEAAVFNDLEVFVPYGEIRLPSGTHALNIDADLIYENGDFIQHFTLHPFDFTTAGTTNVAPTNAITAKFDRMWVDYDVYQDGEQGMLIHVTFSVQGMKGASGQIAYGFEMENGDRLYTSNDNYNSKNGQLTIYRDINPTYEDSYYEDLQVFMPYRELTVGEGSNALRIHTDLIYGDGGNIHLTYHNFTFTRDF